MNPGKLVNLGIFVHTLAQDRVSERERERERDKGNVHSKTTGA